MDGRPPTCWVFQFYILLDREEYNLNNFEIKEMESAKKLSIVSRQKWSVKDASIPMQTADRH